MTHDELNKYIKHYIEEDKTNSAIMLTGDWGTGKSYYIQHSLKPFLEKEENGKHQCVVVSLYGLKDTAEISKSIYLGTRLAFLDDKSEGATTAKFVGKTILKGVAGVFGIDLNADENSLHKLYESVDLSGKLIILEDLERSGIDVLEVLGYVNNLVEQDGIKVLLVANEEEIIKFEKGKLSHGRKKQQQIEAEIQERKNFDLSTDDQEGYTISAKSCDYLYTKEKTVSDTISYFPDLEEIFKNIIKGFNNDTLSAFSEEKSVQEIIGICKSHDITNLRTFIFACQKTVDIYGSIADEIYDINFYKAIFYGIIIFSNRLKHGENVSWGKAEIMTTELSSEDYPLFRFCFDYIMNHSFDKKMIIPAKEKWKQFSQLDRKKAFQDKDLQIIYQWWLRTEKEVIEAVDSVSKRLVNANDINLCEYGRLAVYLIRISHELGCNIEDAKTYLVKNLYNKRDIIDPDVVFIPHLSADEKLEVVEEYRELRKDMTESLAAKDTTIFEFDYKPDSIGALYENVIKQEGRILDDHCFASRLDINKLVEMLKLCTAEHLQIIRGIFIGVYQSGNIGQFLSSDKAHIEALLKEVSELKTYPDYDKIQIMQINYFEQDLLDILERL